MYRKLNTLLSNRALFSPNQKNTLTGRKHELRSCDGRAYTLRSKVALEGGNNEELQNSNVAKRYFPKTEIAASNLSKLPKLCSGHQRERLSYPKSRVYIKAFKAAAGQFNIYNENTVRATRFSEARSGNHRPSVGESVAQTKACFCGIEARRGFKTKVLPQTRAGLVLRSIGHFAKQSDPFGFNTEIESNQHNKCRLRRIFSKCSRPVGPTELRALSRSESEATSINANAPQSAGIGQKSVDHRWLLHNPRDISIKWLEKVGFTFSPFAFIFGTTFLFAALGNTLQKQTGKQWLKTLSHTNLPGFYEKKVCQKGQWVFLESVLSQYINKDNSLLASTTYLDLDAPYSTKLEKAMPQTIPICDQTRATRTFVSKPLAPFGAKGLKPKVELNVAKQGQPELYFDTSARSKSATGAIAGTEQRQRSGCLCEAGVQIQLSPLWGHHLKKDFLGVFQGSLSQRSIVCDHSDKGFSNRAFSPLRGQMKPTSDYSPKLGLSRSSEQSVNRSKIGRLPLRSFGHFASQSDRNCVPDTLRSKVSPRKGLGKGFGYLANYGRGFGRFAHFATQSEQSDPAKYVPDQSSILAPELKTTLACPWYKITAYYPPNFFIVPTWNESTTTQVDHWLDRFQAKPAKTKHAFEPLSGVTGTTLRPTATKDVAKQRVEFVNGAAEQAPKKIIQTDSELRPESKLSSASLSSEAQNSAFTKSGEVAFDSTDERPNFRSLLRNTSVARVCKSALSEAEHAKARKFGAERLYIYNKQNTVLGHPKSGPKQTEGLLTTSVDQLFHKSDSNPSATLIQMVRELELLALCSRAPSWFFGELSPTLLRKVSESKPSTESKPFYFNTGVERLRLEDDSIPSKKYSIYSKKKIHQDTLSARVLHVVRKSFYEYGLSIPSAAEPPTWGAAQLPTGPEVFGGRIETQAPTQSLPLSQSENAPVEPIYLDQLVDSKADVTKFRLSNSSFREAQIWPQRGPESAHFSQGDYEGGLSTMDRVHSAKSFLASKRIIRNGGRLNSEATRHSTKPVVFDHFSEQSVLKIGAKRLEMGYLFKNIARPQKSFWESVHSISGYNFPELQDYEVADLFRSKVRFGRTRMGLQMAASLQAKKRLTLAKLQFARLFVHFRLRCTTAGREFRDTSRREPLSIEKVRVTTQERVTPRITTLPSEAGRRCSQLNKSDKFGFIPPGHICFYTGMNIQPQKGCLLNEHRSLNKLSQSESLLNGNQRLPLNQVFLTPYLYKIPPKVLLYVSNNPENLSAQKTAPFTTLGTSGQTFGHFAKQSGRKRRGGFRLLLLNNEVVQQKQPKVWRMLREAEQAAGVTGTMLRLPLKGVQHGEPETNLDFSIELLSGQSQSKLLLGNFRSLLRNTSVARVCKSALSEAEQAKVRGSKAWTPAAEQSIHIVSRERRAIVNNVDYQRAELLVDDSTTEGRLINNPERIGHFTIRYTPLDLKQENRVKKVFKQLGRNYSDYLKQPKDSLPALLLSPSLEEDKQIEEEEFKRLAQEKAAAKAAAKQTQNEKEYNTSDFTTIDEESTLLDPLEGALREGKNNVNNLEEEPLNEEEIEDSRFERLRFTRELETKKGEEDCRGLALSLTRRGSHFANTSVALADRRSAVTQSGRPMRGLERVGGTELLLHNFRLLSEAEQAKGHVHSPAENGQPELRSANFVNSRRNISGSTLFRSAAPFFLGAQRQTFVHPPRGGNRKLSKAEHEQELCLTRKRVKQFAPKKLEAKVSDRKHSFFGQISFLPTRLFSQEERLVSAHLVNPYIRYDQRNPWLILEQGDVLSDTTFHTKTSKSDDLQNLKNLQTQARLGLIRFVNFPLVSAQRAEIKAGDEGQPLIDSALYTHQTGNQNRIYKSDPRLRLTPLESSLSADWRNLRKVEASPFRVTSKERVYNVLPKLSENQWEKSLEWQLKKHFLDEDTRLESLVATEPFKTFKSKKIERSLPWLTMVGTGELSRTEPSEARESVRLANSNLNCSFEPEWVTLRSKVAETSERQETKVYDGSTERFRKPCLNLFQWPYKTVGLFSPLSLSATLRSKVSDSAFSVAGCVTTTTSTANCTPLVTHDKGVPISFFEEGFWISWLSTALPPHFALQSGRYGHYSKIPLASSFTTYSKDSSAVLKSSNSLFDVTKKLFNSQGDLNTELLFEGASSSSWFFIYRLLLALILKEVLKYIYRISLKDFFIRIINSDFGQTVTSPEFRHKVQFSPFPEFYKPKNRLKDLIGIKNALLPLSEIIWFLRNNCRSRNGPHGVILLGPEGVDTTAIAQAVAGEANVPIIVQSLRALTLTHSHPQKRLEKVLLLARAKSPCVLFLDELDVIGQSREGVIRKTSGNENPLISLDSSQSASLSLTLRSKVGESARTAESPTGATLLRKVYGTPATLRSKVRQSESPDEQSTSQGRRVDLMLRLLTVMDGLHHLNGVVIITTSKNTAMLDPALLRPGRFDRVIHLTLPNHEQRVELFKAKTRPIFDRSFGHFASQSGPPTEATLRSKVSPRGVGHTENLSWHERSSLLSVKELEYLSLRTKNMSGADIISAINYSTLRAIVNETVHTVETLEYGLKCVKALKASA